MKNVWKILVLCLMAAVFLNTGAVKSYAANTGDEYPDYVSCNVEQGDVTITTSGKYYIFGNGNKTTNHITVSGDITVEIILKDVNIECEDSKMYTAFQLVDGAKVLVRIAGTNKLVSGFGAAGIEVPEGTSLTLTSIDGDGENAGTLHAENVSGMGFSTGAAGIGAKGTRYNVGTDNIIATVGEIIINGGTITAIGKDCGAGIGGAYMGTTGTITINGGHVTAMSQVGSIDNSGMMCAAGIGGGIDGQVQTITITGGTVVASSRGSASPGIGAGAYGNTTAGAAATSCGTILITGGNITSGVCKNTMIHRDQVQNVSIGQTDKANPGEVILRGGRLDLGTVGVIHPLTEASGYRIVYPIKFTVLDDRMADGPVTAGVTVGSGSGSDTVQVTGTVSGGKLVLDTTMAVGAMGEQPVTIQVGDYRFEGNVQLGTDTEKTLGQTYRVEIYDGRINKGAKTMQVTFGQGADAVTVPVSTNASDRSMVLSTKLALSLTGTQPVSITGDGITYETTVEFPVGKAIVIGKPLYPMTLMFYDNDMSGKTYTVTSLTVTDASGKALNAADPDKMQDLVADTKLTVLNDTSAKLDLYLPVGKNYTISCRVDQILDGMLLVKSGVRNTKETDQVVIHNNGDTIAFDLSYGSVEFFVDNGKKVVTYYSQDKKKKTFIQEKEDQVFTIVQTQSGTTGNTILINERSEGLKLILNGIDIKAFTNKENTGHGISIFSSKVLLTLQEGSKNYIKMTGSYESGAAVYVFEDSSLTIDGAGSLSVSGYGARGGAGIEVSGNGTVTILDGNITANGGYYSAGIGQTGALSYGSKGGHIIIKGGTVTASPGSGGAAGIGQGSNGEGGTIQIEGGTVNARAGTGTESGAAIGQCVKGIDGIITITGGTISAEGGLRGAGIGQGFSGDYGEVIIEGGVIWARGGSDAAGIGQGHQGKGGKIIIKGGNISVAGGNNASGIGKGSYPSEKVSIVIEGNPGVYDSTSGLDNVTEKSIETVQNDSGTARYAKILYPAPAPTAPMWDTDSFAKAVWTAAEGVSQYQVQLYKDGTVQGDAVTVAAAEYDFTDAVTEKGTYTFSVCSLGSTLEQAPSAYVESAAAGAAGSRTYVQVSYETYAADTLPVQLAVLGDTITEPTGLVKEGHQLTGWYTDSSFEDLWDFAKDKAVADVTLHAKWIISTYRIKLPVQAEQIGYTLTVDQDTVEWNTSAVLTLTLHEGYSKTDDFAVTINGQPVDFTENTYTIEAIREDQTVVVSGVADVTKPTVDFTDMTAGWSEQIGSASFDTFVKEAYTITMAADSSDPTMIAGKICYYISDENLTKDQLDQLDASEWKEYRGAFDLQPDGEYIVYVYAVDASGNKSPYYGTAGIVVDATAPVINGLADSKVYCEAQTFTVTEQYLDYVMINGQKASPEANGTDYALAVGDTYEIMAYDKAGNVSQTMTVTVNGGHTCEYTLSPDGTVITETCIYGDHTASAALVGPTGQLKADGAAHDAEVVYTGTLTVGNQAVISYERDGEAAEETKSVGSYVASITVGDKTATVSYLVEKDPEAFLVTGIQDGETYDEVVIFTVQGEHGVRVEINGEPVTGENVPGSPEDMEQFTLVPGHTYEIVIYDELGNVSDTITVTVNRITYTITLPAVQDQIGYTLSVDQSVVDWNTNAVLTLTLKEGYSRTDSFHVTINGQPVDVIGDTYIITNIKEDKVVAVSGVEDITVPIVVFTDTAAGWSEEIGNASFDKFVKEAYTITMFVDRNDPTMAAGKIYYYISDRNLTEEELNQLEEASWKEYGEPFDLLPDGQYIVYAYAVDESGNKSPYYGTTGIVADATVPVIVGLEDGKDYCDYQTFTVTEKYLDHVLVNGKKMIPGVRTTGYTLAANGPYKIVAYDKAGNASATVSIRIGHIYQYRVEGDKKIETCKNCNHRVVTTIETGENSADHVHTGDRSQPALWSVLCAASAAGIVMFLHQKRKIISMIKERS